MELIRGGKAANSKLKLIRIGVSLQDAEITQEILLNKLKSKYGSDENTTLDSLVAKLGDKGEVDSVMRYLAEEQAIMWQEAV